MNLNKVELIGRVTKTPELKALPSGMKVVKFGIATNHVFFNKDKEKQETTQFHNCVAFGKIAETIGQYVIKGQELYIDGRIEYRSWDKKDGTKAYSTEIMINTFQFGQKPKGTESRTEKEDRGVDTDEVEKTDLDKEFSEEEEIDPADIPF